MNENKKNKKESKENAKIKILAVGDIHGDTGLIKRLAEKTKKENIDVVILAGDLTFAETSVEGLIGPFAEAKKQVLIVPGNHESVSTVHFLSELYKPYAKNLHGNYFIKKHVGFFGSGGADMGVHRISDSEIFELLEKSHQKIKNMDKKIMITHMHPAGSRAEIFGFKGSMAITKAIYEFQPNIVVTSHIHEASGLEEDFGKTKVINVSKKEKVFEI